MCACYFLLVSLHRAEQAEQHFCIRPADGQQSLIHMHASLTESEVVCGVQRLNVSCDNVKVRQKGGRS